MTHLEAERFARRLTRIWAPERAGEVPFGWIFREMRDSHRFDITLILFRDITFHAVYTSYFQSIELRNKHVNGGTLRWDSRRADDIYEDGARCFSEKWRPFFRRNCRLSGTNMECSMHEKMSWIEGFERAEIESWGLTI